MTDVPIDSFKDLLKWVPKTSPNTECIIPLETSVFVDEFGSLKRAYKSPLVIFCHDMAGGYHSYDTTLEEVPDFPTYRFIHWDFIDIFIYFSHNFVTIPPRSWVNVAHRNNVKIYGTVIIELDRKTPCPAFNEIFGSVSPGSGLNNASEFAEKLDTVRRHYGFEGWLINFENRFFDTPKRRVLQRVLYFLRCLKSLGSEVIWYDAVTRAGQLTWQNALNAENSDFLRACYDGLFLNYNWTPQHLASTQIMALSADESRRVFVGVDCFGRGCPGGGGFNTKEALKLILQASKNNPDRPLSVALFAPAWPFEKRHELASLVSSSPLVAGDAEAEVANIFHLDDIFWRPLAPLLSQIRAVGSSSKHIYRPLVPRREGLVTNFSLGMGLCGKSGAGWSCLTKQQILPTCRVLPESTEFTLRVNPDFSDYFSPGNSLRVDVRSQNGAGRSLFMELFLFPNLSLSALAELKVILRFEGPKIPLRVFADLCTFPWHSVTVAREFPVTSRTFIQCRESEEVGSNGSSWTVLSADIGSQLLPLSNSDLVTFVRRVGLVLDQQPSSFLLGGFSLIDSQMCLL